MRLGLAGKLAGILAAIMIAQTAKAQNADWAEKLFESREYDFGVVARGAQARFRIPITNCYEQTVHIASASTVCKCFIPKVLQPKLASRETGYIELSVDTLKFSQHRDSVITVTFNQPFFTEVRIPVKILIRTDIQVNPGSAQFGSVLKGTAAERKLVVIYAGGRDDWMVKEVISKNKNFEASVVENMRNRGRAGYELKVTLKDSAPMGEFREQVTLVTDDEVNPHIPIIIEGRVENEFSVTPDVVSFGNLKPGERKTLNVVVRGRKPFAIKKIESEKSAGTFETRLPPDVRQIHVLPLTVIAPADAGPLTEEFTVTIDGNSEPLTFKAQARIVAPVAGAGSTTNRPTR